MVLPVQATKSNRAVAMFSSLGSFEACSCIFSFPAHSDSHSSAPPYPLTALNQAVYLFHLQLRALPVKSLRNVINNREEKILIELKSELFPEWKKDMSSQIKIYQVSSRKYRNNFTLRLIKLRLQNIKGKKNM